MKTLHRLALPVAALAVTAACPASINRTADTGDTNDYDPDANAPIVIPAFRIAAASWGCTGDTTEDRADDVWYYYVKTDAWMRDPVLSIVETGDPSDDRWAEVGHRMSQLSFDDAGTWDEFALALDSVDDATEVVRGVTTHFSCHVHGSDSLTWKIVAVEDGGSVRDCVSFGHQPIAFFHGIAASSDAGGPIAGDTSCWNGGPATNGQATLD